MEKKKTIVGDEFRTNLLSITPGGSTVEIHYRDRIKVYTKIKNTKAYINAITKKDEDVIAIFVNNIQYKLV